MRLISIHAVLWDRDFKHGLTQTISDISIHAVLWDRDAAVMIVLPGFSDFNPRGPLGPRRTSCSVATEDLGISIHAVLWDRDLAPAAASGSIRNFNPRGPLGPRRREWGRSSSPAVYFNPRGPLGPRRADDRPDDQGE